MLYSILLKSYVYNIPDFEDTVEAKSKEEAVMHFLKQFKHLGWDKEMLLPYVREENKE